MKLTIRILGLFPFFVLLTSCSKEISTTQPIEKGTGKIVVGSNPQGAEIFLNNENTGLVTPDSIIDLEAGSYNVLLKMDLFLDTSFTVQLSENERESIFVDYFTDPRNFGTIACNSEPEGASIFLNDSSTGLSTPHTIQFLEPGSYKVKLTYPEHRADSTSFTLHGNEIKNINLVLQDTSIWVDYNSSNSGFPGNYWAYCITVDQNNIKWIGTRDKGLVRYDERDWTTFNMQNSDLPSNWVTRIKIDDQNRKWICTNGGLAVYDDNSWITYTTDNSDIPFNEVNAIAFDNTGDVWLGSEIRHALFEFDGFNWTSYPINMLGYSESEILSIEAYNNKIFIGTFAGLVILEGDSLRHYGRYNPDFNILNITSIVKDNINGVLIGAQPCTLGYYTEGGLYQYQEDTFFEIDIPEKHIMDISVDLSNNWWLAAGTKSLLFDIGGLMKASPSGNVILFSPDNYDIPQRNISGVAADSNGIIWLSSRRGGIIKFKTGKL